MRPIVDTSFATANLSRIGIEMGHACSLRYERNRTTSCSISDIRGSTLLNVSNMEMGKLTRVEKGLRTKDQQISDIAHDVMHLFIFGIEQKLGFTGSYLQPNGYFREASEFLNVAFQQALMPELPLSNYKIMQIGKHRLSNTESERFNCFMATMSQIIVREFLSDPKNSQMAHGIARGIKIFANEWHDIPPKIGEIRSLALPTLYLDIDGNSLFRRISNLMSKIHIDKISLIGGSATSFREYQPPFDVSESSFLTMPILGKGKRDPSEVLAIFLYFGNQRASKIVIDELK